MPKPRVNLTRFHGVFAPNSKHRARVTPAKRGRGGQHARTADPEEPTPAERRAAMTWAQRLKRVFGIDIETCPACGGAVRIIACIEDPDVIEKILTHLDVKGGEPEATSRPPCRAPPQRGLFDETGEPHDEFVWAVPSAARQRRRLSGKPAGGGEVRRRGRRRGGFGGRDADQHADGRAGTACRRQVPTPIRRDYLLRATDKVVYTAYTRSPGCRRHGHSESLPPQQ